MKNIFFSLTILTLSLGCGSRKANSAKTEKRQEVKVEQKQETSTKTDSTSKKQETVKQETSTKTQSSGWKYTAPAVQIRDSVRLVQSYEIKPFWLKINGDSINVAGLPAGASLESRSESSETVSWMQQRIDQLTHLNKALTTKAEAKQEERVVEKEKIKEVERQSVQWALVVGALLLGLFLPSLLRTVWGFAKAQIPFLSKFTKL